MSLLDAEVQKKLDLRDDQKNRIRSILTDGHQKALRVREQHERTHSSSQTELKALENQTLSDAEKELTDDQKTRWHAMLGDTYMFQSQPRS